MRSSGSRGWLYLAVTGALCVLLLGACSKSASSGASSTTPAGTSTAGTGAATTAGTGAVTNACTLLTKAEVAQATGNSIAFAKQANVGPVSSCTFGSLSGFAVVLSVTSSPAAGLSSDIPGLGNVVTKYHLTPVSGLGDQAYGGSDAIIVRKGNTAFTIVYASFSGGNHEQALKKMATDVVSRL
jgi:Protein of unknown function (DUF3558)